MALAGTRLPYGLRDLKVATLDSAGVKGSLVDLPNGQTLEFTETTESQELRGDDVVVATRTTINGVEWSLEAGGISFEAMVVMVGGTITSTGTTPNIKKSWTRLNTEAYPDFFLEGQAMSESGGDHHVVIYRVKASQFAGTLADQEFWVTSAEGTGIGTLTAADINKVWAMVANETAAAIA